MADEIDALMNAETTTYESWKITDKFRPKPLQTDDFYQSVDWIHLRDKLVWERGNKCQRCELVLDNIHVHHCRGLTVEEYELLCPVCHYKHHGKPEILNGSRCKYCGGIIYWLNCEPMDYDTRKRHACPARLSLKDGCHSMFTFCPDCYIPCYARNGRLYDFNDARRRHDCLLGRLKHSQSRRKADTKPQKDTEA